jgi:hypothetical protein
VVDQLTDEVLGGKWRDQEWWARVSLDMQELPEAQQAAVELGRRAEGWRSALETAQSGEKYVTHWFAGWTRRTREVCQREGYQMIAVDLDATRMGKHRLNVTMDLLEMSPPLWKLEVARRLRIQVSQMELDLAGPPCTTQSRGDSANKTRKKRLIYANYRITSGVDRGKPQHPQGTAKGELARDSDRLNVSTMTMMTRTGWTRGWMVENPRGKMRDQQYMQQWRHHMTDLDYCRLWTAAERAEGYQWQKPSQVWTGDMEGNRWMPAPALCQKECKCADWVLEQGRWRWVHRASLEELTEMVKKTGQTREQLKCTYPENLVRGWLRWAVQRR